MKTLKSINFIEQPEELQVLDMDMIQGGKSDALVSTLDDEKIKNCNFSCSNYR